MDRDLVFYHSPNTRSSGVRVLLEELGAPFTLRALDMKRGEQREAAYLAVNPMGKVPAVLDGGALVTEQVAIFLHLADRFPEAGLAPGLMDGLRGPYLRWMVFYAAAFEPAVVDVAMKREAGERGMSPYGSFEGVLDALEGQLAAGPWLLGERFSAADVLWGMGLGWTMMFKLVPERPVFAAYVARVQGRPAFGAAMAADQALAAEMAGRPQPG